MKEFHQPEDKISTTLEIKHNLNTNKCGKNELLCVLNGFLGTIKNNGYEDCDNIFK